MPREPRKLTNKKLTKIVRRNDDFMLESSEQGRRIARKIDFKKAIRLKGKYLKKKIELNFTKPLIRVGNDGLELGRRNDKLKG